MQTYTRPAFLFLMATFIYILPVKGQFADYRRAEIVRNDGTVVIGKARYKPYPNETKDIIFKDSNGRSNFRIADIKKLSFVDGDQYVSVQKDSTGTRRLLKTILTGDISLLAGRRFYYAQKGDTIAELYDGMDRRGPQSKSIRSRIYLSRLASLFKDCPSINLVPLSKKITRKKLSDLFEDYASCKSLKIENVRKAASIHLGIQGGVIISQFKSVIVGGTKFRESSAAKSGVMLSYDITGRNKILFRMELNTFDVTSTGSHERTIVQFGTEYNQLHIYDMDMKSVELPLGLQYYFFRSKAGLYAAAGCLLNLSTKGTVHMEGYSIVQKSPNIYLPLSDNTSDISANLLGGLWGSVGAEYEPVKKLTFFAEMKIQRSLGLTFKSLAEYYEAGENTVPFVYELAMSSIQPSAGLKYTVR